MIEQNVKNLLSMIPTTNPQGEKVTLVAAVKLQTPTDINRAIAAGITDIGDNHVQEFKGKYDEIEGNPRRHFIGHLQTNKVKYLVGKVDLYHSVDRMELAQELDKRSVKCGVVSDVLLQVNIGNEESKGGFDYDEMDGVYAQTKGMSGLRVVGLMAMLPNSDDEELLRTLATKMRTLYDRLNQDGAGLTNLSMGMSGDWQLCVDCGANMIRLGTAIFGARDYGNKA